MGRMIGLDDLRDRVGLFGVELKPRGGGRRDPGSRGAAPSAGGARRDRAAPRRGTPARSIAAQILASDGGRYPPSRAARPRAQPLRSESASRHGRIRFPRVAPEAVRFVNDAQAALLGEVHCGAAVGVSRVMGLTLGTGVGSAFVVDGRIVTTGPGCRPRAMSIACPADRRNARGCHLGARPSTPISGADRGALRGAGNRRAGACRRRCRGELGVAGIRKNSRHGSQARGNSIPSGSDGPGRSHSQSSDLFLPSAANLLKGAGVSLRASTLLDRAALFGAAMAWRRP